MTISNEAVLARKYLELAVQGVSHANNPALVYALIGIGQVLLSIDDQMDDVANPENLALRLGKVDERN